MDIICVLFLLSSPYRFSFVSVVFDFNASLIDVAPISLMLFPVYLMIMEESGLLMEVTCVLFLLSSRLKSSFSSVVFDFNASLSDVVPVSPMLLPVDLMSMEKSGLLMDDICVLFLLSSPLILSFASAVFDFNASANAFVPISLMLFPVYLMRMKKWIVDGCHLGVVSLSSRFRLSFVSVVFDFNASLNDVTPLPPMLLPFDLIRMKELIVGYHLCAVSCVHHSD